MNTFDPFPSVDPVWRTSPSPSGSHRHSAIVPRSTVLYGASIAPALSLAAAKAGVVIEALSPPAAEAGVVIETHAVMRSRRCVRVAPRWFASLFTRVPTWSMASMFSVATSPSMAPSEPGTLPLLAAYGALFRAAPTSQIACRPPGSCDGPTCPLRSLGWLHVRSDRLLLITCCLSLHGASSSSTHVCLKRCRTLDGLRLLASGSTQMQNSSSPGHVMCSHRLVIWRCSRRDGANEISGSRTVLASPALTLWLPEPGWRIPSSSAFD